MPPACPTCINRPLAPWLLVLAACWAPSLSAQEAAHWAFQPLKRVDVPGTAGASPPANPVDAFMNARRAALGLRPLPAAGLRELARRLWFDLLGLPPTPEELEQVLRDQRPDAYERLVDRLLADPRHGEHWARMWLDAVRYAETAGFNADPERPLAYQYRNYVIEALNSDLPYDEFIKQQIAGDELYPEDPRAAIATGYLVMWPDESNASNVELARQEALNDLTANVGTVFLGLSMGCAQCHNHKFDPIPQRDFYKLQAFFAGVVRRDEAPLGSPSQLEAYQGQLDAWLNQTRALREELAGLEHDARILAAGDRRMKFPAVVLQAIDTPPEQRTTLQRQLAFWSERQIEIKEEQILSHLSAEQRARRARLVAELEAWNRRKPLPPGEVRGMVAGEVEQHPPQTYLLANGSYNKPLEEVPPGFPEALRHVSGVEAHCQPRFFRSSGRRAALALWLADPRHPLVPRVIVNRVWQGHFGRGLVPNANDFGTQSPAPEQLDLLDWLAARFVEPVEPSPAAGHSGHGMGYSLKRLHKLLVTSAVYRQRSLEEPVPANHPDPGNQHLWHHPRRRLAAEQLRDAMLAVSGRLNGALYGSSVRPELPADFSKREAWTTSKSEADRARRSIYIHAKRNLPYPFLEAFDFPDMHESCARRSETTVAPQALMLLNGELTLGFARSFAGRLLVSNPRADAAELVEQAWRLALGREPGSDERAWACEFIEAAAAIASGRLAAGRAVLLPRGMPKFLDPARGAAVVDLCHLLLNTNEFLYVD